MTDPTSPADRMLAEIRDWAATLPTRCPTLLRVGSGVTRELNGGKPVDRPLIEPPLPYGVDIVEDPDYPPGQWRIFDQWDDEISAGVLPVVGATVSVNLGDGSRKDMRVIALRRDETGRIVDYTAADPALFEIPEPADRLFPYPTGLFFR